MVFILFSWALLCYVRLLASQFRLSSVCMSVTLVFLTQGTELCRNIFAPYCSQAIWLSCEENRAKTFTNVFPQGVVMNKGGMKKL